MIDKVMFIGSKHLGWLALERLSAVAPEKLCCAVTLDDVSDVRCKLPEIRELAQARGLRLAILTKPGQLAELIRKENPDLVLVAGWYWLIGPGLLREPPHGFLGVHPSLLPKYRGGAPLVWPIINGESEAGISLFYFDEGMDSGDLVAQRRFDIGPDETIGQVLTKAEAVLGEMIDKYYPLLLQNAAPRTPQDHSQATYCSQRSPEDGRLDWNKTAARIHNEIRAQTRPYPGAFCTDQTGRRVKIWSARVFESKYYGPPGLVVENSGDWALVTCGRGAIRILEAQPEGQEPSPGGAVFKFGQRLR